MPMVTRARRQSKTKGKIGKKKLGKLLRRTRRIKWKATGRRKAKR